MANEFYRFISFDGRDANQLQAYLRVINNATYLKYTYINPADLEWVESIEAGDRVGFFQNDADRATANILAPYDTENGFRLEEAPQPDLIEGQYYEIRYSRPRPADQIPTPPENRGWSPLYGLEYLNFDGTTYTVSNTMTAIFAFRVTDWTSGQGQKPQLGYIGVNGLVGDVNNAAILRLPQGPAGESTQWTEGTAFPASPNNNDLHLFKAEVTGLANYVEADGSTAKTTAAPGEVAQYKTDKWVFVLQLSIQGTSTDELNALTSRLERVENLTVDIHLQETPGDFANLNDATVAGISLIQNTPGNRVALDGRTYNFAGLTWQNTTVDIPNDNNEYWVVVRVAKELGHIETQFQLINNDPEEGTEHLRRSRQEDNNWRYYQVTADRESIWTLQRRPPNTHTRWDAPIGDIPQRQVQAIIDAAINGVMARLLPDPSTGNVGDVPKVNAAQDNYELAPDLQGSGSGGGLTSQQVTAIANARAAARFTDEEKTKLANAVVSADLDPYGLGFIGIYPRYMRLDQLDDNIIIAFGEIHEPYDEANRIEVSFNGVQVVRNEFSPTTRFFRFGIEPTGANNIRNNTHRDAQHWDVQITFYKDGFLDANVIGNIRTIPVIINRDSAPVSPDGDGKVIYTSDRPENDAGKVGDTAFRNLTNRISIYEKTGAAVWTYKYDIPKRFTAEDIYNLIADERTRYLKLGINTGLTIALANAVTPTTLTFAATALQSNENTGHITRATAGDGIDLKAGTYRIWTRVSMATPSDNVRSNLNVDIYDVTNSTELDKDMNCGYIRSLDFLETESILARNTITLTSDTKIAVRAQLGTVQGGSATALAVPTAANGYVYIEKL